MGIESHLGLCGTARAGWNTAQSRWVAVSLADGSLVRELLLPTDDRVVALQVAVVLVLGVAGTFAARRHPEVRLLLIGIVLLILAGMGLRALH